MSTRGLSIGLLLAALALLVGCNRQTEDRQAAPALADPDGAMIDQTTYSEALFVFNAERQELERLKRALSECEAAHSRVLPEARAMSKMEFLSKGPAYISNESKSFDKTSGDLKRKIAEQKERVAKAEAAKNAAQPK